jgi:hypothetical protein
MNPLMIESVFSSDCSILQAINLLNRTRTTFGSRYKVNLDLKEALEAVDTRIKELINGEYCSLIVDSATLKHDSAIAVMISCARVQHPLMASLITPTQKSHDEDPDNDVYNFELAAADILKAAENMGINLKEQVTCVMGDNVNHNKAIADALGTAKLSL